MTERDMAREWAIVNAALVDLLEAGSWASPETKDYIREHMIPNVYRDWRENAPVPIGDDWEDYR